MGLVMEHAETIEGYEAVPLALPDHTCPQGSGAAVLRRRSARPGRRAVMYVHCRGDSFAPEDLVGWYTDRGFHFYAADLREVGADERPGGDANQAAQDLGDCFACLDAAAAHVREVDAIDTMIVSAHGAGAVIAALWCHARRGSQPADALVLASPSWAHRAVMAGMGQARRGEADAGGAPLAVAGRRPPQAPARPGHRLPGPGDVPGDRLERAGRRRGPAGAAGADPAPRDHAAWRARDLAEAGGRAARPGHAGGRRAAACVRRAWPLAQCLPVRADPRSAALTCPRSAAGSAGRG